MKFTCSLFLMLLFVATLDAFQSETKENWPAWRGPTLNGHAGENADPPQQWSEDKNVSWKIELPGLGNSTPCVWENRVILTYTRPTGKKIEPPPTDNSGKPKPDEFHELIVIAYDLETGKEVWKTKVGETVPKETVHSTSSYASASAVTNGDRIFAFFGSMGLFALDMQGNEIWNREMPSMTTAAGFGEGASPALQDNVLVIPWDEEGQSFIAGVDTANGKDIWRTQRETGTSWTTPLNRKDGEQQGVIVSGTSQTRAYNLQNGQEVWHCGGMSSNPTSSPVAEGNVVFVGNSFKGKVVQAIRFDGATGDLSKNENLLWTYRKSASYVPTPVVIKDKLYFLRGSTGVLTCVDAKTGDEVFAGKRLGLKNVHSSPIVAANRIYVSSREGDTVVVAPDEDCKILATNHLDDVFDASPVAIGSRLILRGRKNLYCIE